MMYLLDPSKQEEAIELATTLDPNISGISLQVSNVVIVELQHCNIFTPAEGRMF